MNFVPITDPIECKRLLLRVHEIGARAELSWDGMPAMKGRVLEAPGETSEMLIRMDQAPIDPPKNIENPMALIFIPGVMALGVRPKSIDWARSPVCALSPPFTFAKLQRRKEPRYTILDGYDIKIWVDAAEGENRKVARRLLDLSNRGLGFHILSPREAALYPKGMILKGMRLELENQEIILDGKVVNHNQLSSSRPRLGGVQIGVEITKVGTKDSDAIFRFVARGLVQQAQ